jgi:hypothetical protein
MSPVELALTGDKRSVEGAGDVIVEHHAPDLVNACCNRSDPMARVMPADPAGRLGISAQTQPKSAARDAATTRYALAAALWELWPCELTQSLRLAALRGVLRARLPA